MRRTTQALVAALTIAALALTLACEPAEPKPRESSPASAKAVAASAPAVPNELLVRVQPGGALPLHLADRLLGAREISRLEAIGVVRLKIDPKMGVGLATDVYERLPFVEYAEPNYILREAMVPDDPMYGAYQRWYYELIEAPDAWDLGPGTRPAVLAVLDTGVDIHHPDLEGKIWVNQDETAGNGVDDDGNGCVDDVHGCNLVDPKTADIACVGRPRGPSSDVSDADGHGTFVAGIVAARANNQQGVAGTADGVAIMPVKVLACTGGGTSADISAGILYAAENGAQVINMSFGAHLESQTIRDAIGTAHDDFGVVLVAASGNDDTGEVSFPANLPEVIAVGASDHKKPDERAPFSNWGPEVEVAAPGVDIASTVPSDLCGRNWSCIGSLPYSRASGTSFAAPQVSALAGLLLSRDPALSNEGVRQIIKATAAPLPDASFTNWAGSGRIRMREALEFNPEEVPAAGMRPGCNMVTLTFATGTDAATVAAAVSPASALDAIWRLDNSSGSFQAFRPQAPQASDLHTLNPLDAVFLCLNATADITMPTLSPDPSTTISTPLAAGCNVLGLSFPDGTDPSLVADAVSPADAFESMWRLDNASGSFQAYMAAAPEASDLTSLQFLDAVFLCTGRSASLTMPALAGAAAGPDLHSVTSWAYQTQDLEADGAVDALVASDYDLLVIEPTRSNVGSEGFDTAGLVRRLHERGKLVLAYVDIGEAEDYRTYWQDEWRAPSTGGPGIPDFLLATDPGGWSGDYPVAFWDERWKDIVIYDEGSLLDMALDDGFDGIYMDWVEAYSDDHVAAAAAAEGLDPAAEMVSFIKEIRDYARGRHPGFLVVAQNAAELAAERPDYLGIIDGLAQEDLSFQGEADTKWGDPKSGDIPTPQEDREWLTDLFRLYLDAGLPVFCVDYALQEDNVRAAYDTAERAGCLGYVSQTPLSRLTDTPPPP